MTAKTLSSQLSSALTPTAPGHLANKAYVDSAIITERTAAATQTNKTLTTPTITSPAITGSPTINGAIPMTVGIQTISVATTLAALSANQYIVLMAAGGVPTLPTAVGNFSIYVLKNISGGAITPVTTSSQTIEGAAPTALGNGTSLTLVSDQTGWRII